MGWATGGGGTRKVTWRMFLLQPSAAVLGPGSRPAGIQPLAGEVHLTVDHHPTLSPNSDLTKPLPWFILRQYGETGLVCTTAGRLEHARKSGLVTFGDETLFQELRIQGTTEHLEGTCHPGANKSGLPSV